MPGQVGPVVASAPAKVILFGEHFVVYGVPAIVAAIDLRARARISRRDDELIRIRAPDLGISGSFSQDGHFLPELGREGAEGTLKPIFIAVREVLRSLGVSSGLDVEVRSSIPIAAGLGSSAAVAVSTAAAVHWLLSRRLDRELVFNAALEAEKLVHITPSGVDPAISTYGGLLKYTRGVGIEHLKAPGQMELVVGDTGLKRSTGALVSAVRALRDRRPSLFSRILDAAGELVAEALQALERGDLEALGELMDINHGLLCSIGVSNEALDRLVHSARRAGALGAKLTGAGGGGCMIALVEPGMGQDVARAIEEAGGRAFLAKLSLEGVRIEAAP